MHNENSKVLSTAKCGMHKLIKLNYFEHINVLESCKQPGIYNKSSNFISEMVLSVEMKIQVPNHPCLMNLQGKHLLQHL